MSEYSTLITDIARVIFILAMFASGCIMGAMFQRLRMINRMRACERDMLSAHREANAYKSAMKAQAYKSRCLAEDLEAAEREMSIMEAELDAATGCVQWPQLCQFERN